MKQVWKVRHVAGWDGWCSPCEREDRPLVLTRSGPGGLRSWLAGLGDDDRLLLLTCRVCGQWQIVPRCEEDDPEIRLEPDVVEAAHEVLVQARAVDALVELLRRDRPMPVVATRVESVPVESVPVEPVAPVEAAAPAEPVRAAAAAAVRTPRRPLVLVPPPAVSPEQRDAAARVLAAALGRPAPSRTCRAERARRRRRGPTPRRAGRPALVRVPIATGSVTSIALPSGAQVVLAVPA